MQRALVVHCVCDAHSSDYGQVSTRVGVSLGHQHHISSNFCTNALFCQSLSTFALLVSSFSNSHLIDRDIFLSFFRFRMAFVFQVVLAAPTTWLLD